MTAEKNKILVIAGILCVYILAGVIFNVLASQGIIQRAQPTEPDSTAADIPTEAKITPALEAAESFLEKNMQKAGHIDLYYVINSSQSYEFQNFTNSEAVSYYLLWTAKAGQKVAFDNELDFLEKKMLSKKGYLMWRLSPEGLPINDGVNIASDADLRTIQALMIAEKQWDDPRYTRLINTLAKGLENIGITQDGLLAPYGGYSGEKPWRANEVWLSYNEFTTVDALAKTRGEPWKTLYVKMKNATLHAQIANGLYNSMLTEKRQYGNGIDNGAYSINSLWMMVRSAESGDPELMASARKSLEFYKSRFQNENSTIYTSYSSSGDPLTSYDAPWVYALVGRAAVALGDEEASKKFVDRLITFQVSDEKSKLYGALPEGKGEVPRVGQFTMQESILTLQAYVQKFGGG